MSDEEKDRDLISGVPVLAGVHVSESNWIKHLRESVDDAKEYVRALEALRDRQAAEIESLNARVGELEAQLEATGEELGKVQLAYEMSEALRSGKLEQCERCGWPLAETSDKGCVPGNCSQRPLPDQGGEGEKDA